MRFEGDTCTLSFGLYPRKNQVQLQGTVWPRGSTNPQYEAVRPSVPFSTFFTPDDVDLLQQWLLNGADDDILLPEPLQLARRLTPIDSDLLTFEIQFGLAEVPEWWRWDTAFPLRVQVDVHRSEFSFLAQSLDRHHWFDN
ncbi:hypothetical protein [Spirosoma rhododendri]|uniref:Uncharacterized protein n=1 Tax=Spirosoma rhododendri TaxID=2728024 RepID=A0A7L5DSQ5_9BACT|nr:hypothetical protein [Spirosoma rhododendri]QJD80642.1 hypothetical protein HH216_21145 [Spirosoma rhododendri]